METSICGHIMKIKYFCMMRKTTDMKTKTFLLAIALCCVLGAKAQDEKAWIGTWAAAAEFTGPSDMPASPLTNRSLREIVKVSIGGDQLRLRLSNEFSRQAVEIKSVFIADALDSCDIAPKTARYLTFSGRRNVTIAPGATLWSDVCHYPLRPLQRLAVTISYGSTPENATSHRGSRTTSYIISGEAKPKTRFGQGERVDHWYNIAAIDVPAAGQECIAVLGNSITDGRGSTTNKQNRWPDIMAEALAASGKPYAVLNLGIGGNCVMEGGLSEPAMKRFDRDILGQNGVRTLIIFQGTNDIGTSRHSEQTARKLKEAYTTLAEKAHAAGLRVLGATITPFKGNGWYSPYHEAARQEVNAWIRTTKSFDGVIDFDELMRDPSAPDQMRKAVQEDWLHPNAAGYEEMGRFAAQEILKK